MKSEHQLSRVAHADLNRREASALPEAPLLTHISLIKRRGFASLTASYIWALNRDWFIDIPAKLPKDLAEQAPAEGRDRENKVIENEWERRGRSWESYTRFAATRRDARDDKTISLRWGHCDRLDSVYSTTNPPDSLYSHAGLPHSPSLIHWLRHDEQR